MIDLLEQSLLNCHKNVQNKFINLCVFLTNLEQFHEEIKENVRLNKIKCGDFYLRQLANLDD